MRYNLRFLFALATLLTLSNLNHAQSTPTAAPQEAITPRVRKNLISINFFNSPFSKLELDYQRQLGPKTRLRVDVSTNSRDIYHQSSYYVYKDSAVSYRNLTEDKFQLATKLGFERAKYENDFSFFYGAQILLGYYSGEFTGKFNSTMPTDEFFNFIITGGTGFYANFDIALAESQIKVETQRTTDTYTAGIILPIGIRGNLGKRIELRAQLNPQFSVDEAKSNSTYNDGSIAARNVTTLNFDIENVAMYVGFKF